MSVSEDDDCLYTGISSGPNTRYRVWEAFTFYLLVLETFHWQQRVDDIKGVNCWMKKCWSALTDDPGWCDVTYTTSAAMTRQNEGTTNSRLFNQRACVCVCVCVCVFTPFPQIDIIGAMVIVWRVRGKIIRSVLCNIVRNNCAQCNAHTYEQT